MSGLRAAVLAGGLGMRMRPYTTVLPKPLVPIDGRPILSIIFDWLAEHGATRVDVCLGHLGQLIQTYYSQAQALPDGLDVRWHWEHEPLGTAGALRQLDDVTDDLLVVNGDIVTDLDPAEVLAFHRERGAALTVCTHRAEVRTDLGVVVHTGGEVSDYREKPVIEYDVSMGVYVYAPHVVRGLSDGPLQFPDVVLALLEAGEPVAAYVTSASWTHVGTIAQYEAAAREFRGENLDE